jgi:hypothetical protein
VTELRALPNESPADTTHRLFRAGLTGLDCDPTNPQALFYILRATEVATRARICDETSRRLVVGLTTLLESFTSFEDAIPVLQSDIVAARIGLLEVCPSLAQ